MAIKAVEFDDLAWSKDLWPVTALLGDETFFTTRLGDLWRMKGQEQKYTERKVLHQTESEISNRLLVEMNAMSLFANRSLIELKLSRAGLDKSLRLALLLWLQNPPDDKRLLITGPKIGKSETSSEWYKTLNQTNALIEANPISSYQFPKWLDKELQHHQILMDADAKAALQIHTEGNLLAVGQVIERLKMIHPNSVAGPILSLEYVLETLTQSARYTPYNLVDLALKGDISGVNRITDLLESEGLEAITALWTISRELNILLQIRYQMDQGKSANQAIQSLQVWRSRETLMQEAVNRLSLTQLRKMLSLSHETDRSIKGASKEPAWSMIKDILLGLAGRPMTR